VAVVDIGGAFLNADMDTGILVHMRLDATMSGLLCRLDPRYEDFMDSRGCIVVRLDKALNGCVESAALWYDNLSQSMQNLGYECNEYEPCVFNRLDERGTQCTATVHVDDLFISSRSPSMIEHLCEGLKTRYGDITRKDGPVVSYLGMTFDLSCPGEARLTMHGYVQEVLKSSGVIGTAKTPATDGLFELRETSPKLTTSQSKWFHRHVARIAYLAKRAKPESLPTVAFLSTRVTCCNEDDMDKLIRLLKYLRESEDRGLVLRPGTKGITVRVFVDAAYGVHADTKSHTGSCVVIGDTESVHCKSTKQSIMTKSSTEAELVALSDSANQGLFLRNFLHHQGYDLGPVILYQDNMSTMGLLARGRSGAEKTRHILIRYYWVSEQVANGTAIVEHKGTKDMHACKDIP
jgi:Reverse transcriptase (RNA-dependent DNA polymerase)